MNNLTLKQLLEKEDSLYDGIKYHTFTNEEIKDVRFTNSEFQNCQFINCRFEQCDFADTSFTNCVFQACSLTHMRLDGAVFYQTKIEGCRMLGISWVEARFKNTVILNCKCSYGNFTLTNWKLSEVKDSDFTETCFSQAKFDLFKNNNACFRQANFMHAVLNGVNFSDSEIEGCLFAPEDVKGMLVNQRQAAELAVLFGVKVTDW